MLVVSPSPAAVGPQPPPAAPGPWGDPTKRASFNLRLCHTGPFCRGVLESDTLASPQWLTRRRGLLSHGVAVLTVVSSVPCPQGRGGCSQAPPGARAAPWSAVTPSTCGKSHMGLPHTGPGLPHTGHAAGVPERLGLAQRKRARAPGCRAVRRREDGTPGLGAA